VKADEFYTPEDVADALVESLPSRAFRSAVDFAAGDGALLKAVARAHPRCKIVALDIDPFVVRRLRREHSKWDVFQGDFLDRRAWKPGLRAVSGSIDLAILNPPFSCRGGARHMLVMGEDSIACSLACAFLLQTTTFLAENGVVAFLMPAGFPGSQKDAAARAWLRERGKLTFTELHGRGTFDECFPAVVAGTFVAGAGVARSRLRLVPPRPSEWTLVRGTLQVREANESRRGARFVHSTHLLGGTLDVARCSRVGNGRRFVGGPAVLLPRVGNPTMKKVTVYAGRDEIVPSDCVIALRCRSIAHAEETRAIIHENWARLERSYQGTCAKFITMDRLSAFLHGLQCRGAGARRVSVAVRPHRARLGRPSTLEKSIVHREASQHIRSTKGVSG
jgi:hypothetical protein